MTTFGLVHGAWHGSWCWDLLTEELRARGHHVVAVDLPCEDPTAGAEEYAQVVIEGLRAAEADQGVVAGVGLRPAPAADAYGRPHDLGVPNSDFRRRDVRISGQVGEAGAGGLGFERGRGQRGRTGQREQSASEVSDGDSDVVLVSHSTGGLTIPVVAERLAALGRPVRRMVFLAPFLPQPGRSADQLRASEPDRLMPGFGAGQVGHGDGSSTWQPHAAIATMYPDAPPPLAEWAAQRLRRQHWQVTREITPLKAWPTSPVTMIACAADAVVNPDWVRRTAGVRFGAEAHVLPGDHAPFLTRPRQLADLLLAS